MVTVLEHTNKFLERKKEDCVFYKDMIDRLLIPGMEFQVNVSAGNDGQPVEGKKSCWTNGSYEWWPIRVPKQANTEPFWDDYKLTWPYELHAESIGATGWNWERKESLYLGYDFDAISGHAVGVGVSDDMLKKIQEVAQGLDYVEVRNSTSGNGIHFYVHVEGFPCENHTVHQALGRAVLQIMSQEAGFDFGSAIDACGSNMWHWSVRATSENEGLKLLKPAERKVTPKDLPSNWRDNIDVVTRRRGKVRVASVPETEEELFEAMASARPPISLDDNHKKHMVAIGELGYVCNWVPDHNLLQTHTCGLAEIAEDPEMKIRGIFKTNSPGRNKAEANCFLYPMYDGTWRVQRFGVDHREHESWNHERGKYTWCYFNRNANLHAAATAAGGAEMDGGGYQFKDLKDAKPVLDNLGSDVDLTEKYHGRAGELKPSKDGRLLARVKMEDKNEEPEEGWVVKRGWLEKIFNVQTEDDESTKELEDIELDNTIRCCITPAGNEACWTLKAANGNWNRHSKDNCKSALKYLGFGQQWEQACGSAIMRSWTLVNLPFKPEYPGNRQWNLDGAQLRFKPSAEPGNHPHWDMILDHIGGDLDRYLRDEQWAIDSNIKTGAQYLQAWIANMLRHPFEPLPYLFLFGEQNSGKSIIHEACSLLMTKGVVSADRCLTNNNDFNGELAGAILCYIEEKDISAAGKAAYNRIKDYVTSKTLSIRKMRMDAYEQANSTHWIQCANERGACPIFPGDTRITMVHVGPILDEIPKSVLIERLEKEAPYFLRTLLDMTLPKVVGRLRLPVIHTDHKDVVVENFTNPVEQFIQEMCYDMPGEIIWYKDFYDKFIEWVGPDQKFDWSKQKVSRSFPDNLVYGTYHNNQRAIGNLSWTPEVSVADDHDITPFILAKGRLVKDK